MAVDDPAHELDSPPWRRIDGTLIATARALRSVYDQAMSEIDLSLPEASLICMVTERGGMTQTQLAHSLGAGRASTGVRIDALEKRGLVARQPSTTDRRVWVVQATGEGKMVAAEVDRIDAELRGPLRDGISRRERQVLASILLRVQRNLTNMADELSCQGRS